MTQKPTLNQKPTSVLILSVMGILFGALNIFGAPCGLLLNFKPLTPNPITTAMNADPIFVVALCLSSALGFFLAIMLLVSSIGTLNLKPWARTAILAFAWIQIVSALFGALFNFIYAIPKMYIVAKDLTGGNLAIIMASAVTILTLLFGVAFPIAILICYRRTNVINAFKGIFPVSPTNFPVT